MRGMPTPLALIATSSPLRVSSVKATTPATRHEIGSTMCIAIGTRYGTY